MAAPIADKIILPLDTGNTGKNNRTQTRVIGADTVHEHFVVSVSQRSIVGGYKANAGVLTVPAAVHTGTRSARHRRGLRRRSHAGAPDEAARPSAWASRRCRGHAGARRPGLPAGRERRGLVRAGRPAAGLRAARVPERRPAAIAVDIPAIEVSSPGATPAGAATVAGELPTVVRPAEPGPVRDLARLDLDAARRRRTDARLDFRSAYVAELRRRRSAA